MCRSLRLALFLVAATALAGLIDASDHAAEKLEPETGCRLLYRKVIPSKLGLRTEVTRKQDLVSLAERFVSRITPKVSRRFSTTGYRNPGELTRDIDRSPEPIRQYARMIRG